MNDTKALLEAVKDGLVSVDEALLELKKAPFEDLGYAKIDLHRKQRQGIPEVIFGQNKTAEQICGILEAMNKSGEQTVLITRLSEDKAEAIQQKMPLTYNRAGRIGCTGNTAEPKGIGPVVVATGGTSDMPVAEEAAFTAEVLGNEVIRLYDVGVSGLHRLLSHMDEIMSASVIVAIAGMEGALASVIGGLADCPVLAVPTSVGYGTAFGGVTALLSMLNSCASGVSVVNIDNGFGAGYLASMMNHMAEK